MKPRITRDFGRIGDAVPVPNLIEVQLASYSRFLQEEAPVKPLYSVQAQQAIPQLQQGQVCQNVLLF